MKNFDLVYVNGDSYAAAKKFKIYGEHIADYFNSQFINNAVPGSSNSRIFRTSLRDLIDLKEKNKNILACISLSFIFRTELWDVDHCIEQFRNTNDGDFFSTQLMQNHNWFKTKILLDDESKKYSNFLKQTTIWYNIEAETVKLLEKIILFVHWCKNNNVDYIIFSPMYQETVDFSAPFISNFYKEIKKNKRVLDPFEFSFLEWCLDRDHTPIDNYEAVVNGKKYQVGHMGASGHEDFAKFLLENYFNS